MNLGELGEFGAIDRMTARLGVAPGVADPAGVLGIGDDTAVIPAPDGSCTLFTIDTMVEGVHFLRDTPSDYTGFKVIAASASDVAAMGGTPVAAVVSVACPRLVSVEWLDALYDGAREAAERFEVRLVGGDTSAAAQVVLTVAMTGTCRAPAPILRSGAKPGEMVCVTGAFGGASGGLRILAMERLLKKPEEDYGHPGLRLLQRHLKPEARLAAGRALAEAGATSMIDVSDGLVADLGHICERSGVAMTVDALAVPINPDLDFVADRIAHDVLVTTLTGGEDFELAVTLPQERFEAAAAAVGVVGTTLTKIGVVEAPKRKKDRHVRVMREGKEMSLGPTGWVHFKQDE